jgi:type II secretory pathway pseudopilin PulG
MKRERGFTLVVVMVILGVLAGLASLLTAPAMMQSRRVQLHYAKAQAEYLSLAGLERARAHAAQGRLGQEQYRLGEGTVRLTMEEIEPNMCRVVSVGSVRPAWREQAVETRSETRIQLP